MPRTAQPSLQRPCKALRDCLRPAAPPSTQLIDKLGGPSQVAEMTGRKARVVRDDRGRGVYQMRAKVGRGLVGIGGEGAWTHAEPSQVTPCRRSWLRMGLP